MQNMLAYTIQSGSYSGGSPYLIVGQGKAAVRMTPQNPQDDSYWIVVLYNMNPTYKVKEWVVPGSNNSSVPADLDTFMSDPQFIFAIVTQYLSTLHVPQGDFYNYLVKYGAGRALQRLEQINAVLGCGSIGRMNYLLTSMGGPRGGGNPQPPSYELGSTSGSVLSLMSLMPLPDGQPPYAICDNNTF